MALSPPMGEAERARAGHSPPDRSTMTGFDERSRRGPGSGRSRRRLTQPPTWPPPRRRRAAVRRRRDWCTAPGLPAPPGVTEAEPPGRLDRVELPAGALTPTVARRPYTSRLSWPASEKKTSASGASAAVQGDSANLPQAVQQSFEAVLVLLDRAHRLQHAGPTVGGVRAEARDVVHRRGGAGEQL